MTGLRLCDSLTQSLKADVDAYKQENDVLKKTNLGLIKDLDRAIHPIVPEWVWPVVGFISGAVGFKLITR